MHTFRVSTVAVLMNRFARKSTYLILFVLCAFASLLALQSAIAGPNEDLQAGLDAARNGNIALAKEKLEGVVANYPALPCAAMASWKLGYIAMKQGDRDTARARFNWVLANHPTQSCAAITSWNLGLMAMEDGDLDSARARFNWILTNHPTQPCAAVASWKLGRMATKQGDRDTARTRFNWVLANHPTHIMSANALLGLADLERKKKPHEAERLFKEVTTRFPNTQLAKTATVELAGFYNNRHEYDQAIVLAKSVREDAEATPGLKAGATLQEAEGHLQMWRCRGNVDDLTAGVALLEEVPTKFPTKVKEVSKSQIRLACYYISPGRQSEDEYYRRNPAKARSIMENALATLPVNYCTWWMRSEILASYVAENRLQDALSECTSMLSDNPPTSWKTYFLYMKGDLYLRLDQTQEGIATLRQLVSDYPDDHWATAARELLNVEGGQGQ